MTSRIPLLAGLLFLVVLSAFTAGRLVQGREDREFYCTKERKEK